MARGKSRGKSARKARRTAISKQEEVFEKVPHSFVFHRGKIGRTLRRLVQDMRHLFEPYTASSLHPRKSNSLRDFVSVAGPLNVHFFIIITKTASGVYLKIARVPHGPTLTFRVVSYSLAADVLSALRKYNVQPSLFCQPPLLILNGFGGDGTNVGGTADDATQGGAKPRDASADGSNGKEAETAKRPSAMHFSLVTTVLQNAFAPLNVNKLKLDNVTRVTMFNYEPETNLFEFRHYRVKAVPLGLSRPIRKLLKKQVPDLSRFTDVADYVERGANFQTTSESEAELLHDEDAHVVLPTSMAGRGNEASHKSAIRLYDIGPRMTLQLVKIEDGLCNGAVLFHAFLKKSKEELADLATRRREKQRIKQERRRQQDENVRRKQAAEGRKRVRFEDGEEGDASPHSESEYDADGDDDNDNERPARTYVRAGAKRPNKERNQDRYGQQNSSRPARQPMRKPIANRRVPKFRVQTGASS